MSNQTEVVTFHTISELSTLKHFSEQTIRDCITSVCHQHKIASETVDVEKVFQDVKQAYQALSETYI